MEGVSTATGQAAGVLVEGDIPPTSVDVRPRVHGPLDNLPVIAAHKQQTRFGRAGNGRRVLSKFTHLLKARVHAPRDSNRHGARTRRTPQEDRFLGVPRDALNTVEGNAHLK